MRERITMSLPSVLRRPNEGRTIIATAAGCVAIPQGYGMTLGWTPGMDGTGVRGVAQDGGAGLRAGAIAGPGGQAGIIPPAGAGPITAAIGDLPTMRALDGATGTPITTLIGAGAPLLRPLAAITTRRALIPRRGVLPPILPREALLSHRRAPRRDVALPPPHPVGLLIPLPREGDVVPLLPQVGGPARPAA
jgi:hypothetical protein